ncbi:type I-F CRISPR-associated endoribonuclease Cas6/Csy4 [Acetobacter sp. AAB5]|uniref:type I-F CRISPR-associated endoribonuclease Cas6/Csy4 n=1 Tax=Acetobacter sp. AAB5 TaxID=3418370 RepID=UPI003CED5AA8
MYHSRWCLRQRRIKGHSMLSHYIQIRCLSPDQEILASDIMSRLFYRLHGAIASLQTSEIGASFPNHTLTSVGDVLRVHGSENILTRVLDGGWLFRMEDYTLSSGIMVVPEQVKYRCVSRVRAKSSAPRLRRRLMRRHDISAEDAERRIPDSVERRLQFPSILMCSKGTSTFSYPIFIKHGSLFNMPVPGEFSGYGLSSKATIPWF